MTHRKIKADEVPIQDLTATLAYWQLAFGAAPCRECNGHIGYGDDPERCARCFGTSFDPDHKLASQRLTHSITAERRAKELQRELDEAGDIISTYHDALLTALQIGKADLCHDCNGEGVVAVEVEHQAHNGSFVQPTSIEPGTCERCRGIGREW